MNERNNLRSIIIFTNCSSTIKLEDFKPKTIHESAYAPTKEDLKFENKNVAIIKIDDSKIKLARQLNLGDIISREIQNELSSIGTQSIISSKKSDINPNNFKYIISGKINKTTYKYEYRKAAPAISLITGKKVISPAEHIYKACISGILEITILPSSELVDTISFDKCTLESHSANNPKKRNNSGVIIKGAKETIKSVDVNLKNFFGYRGYISQQKTDGKKTIVKTTLGKNHGAKKSENVEFFTMSQSGKRLIGKGKISNQIDNNSSWVIIEHLNDGTELKSGDFIKIKYEKGLFD